jgi:hypothetical protein
MALIVADRVLESSTSTGTGNFSLAGAATGYRAFDDVCANGDTVYYTIEAVDGNGNPSGAWETGLGTFNDTDTLVRTSVSASSNANNAVDFAAGTKRVFLNVNAAHVANFIAVAGGAGTPLSDPNADRILFWDDSAGAIGLLTANSGLAISGTNLNNTGGASGTSFPVSPATDDKFYRTDTRIEYFYDGTRWLSTSVHVLPISMGAGTFPLTSSVALRAGHPHVGVHDIYIEEIWIVALLASTPASNHMSCQFQSADGNGASVNIGSALATNGLTVSTWTRVSATINAVLAKTVEQINVTCTASGSPSAYITPALRYRLVG